MEREIIEVPVVSEVVRSLGAPLSPVVRAGNLVFVSGLPPIDPITGELVTGSITDQAEAVMRALAAALNAAGSSLAEMVKVSIFVSNAAHFDEINRIYARHVGASFPARTFVAVGSWPMPIDIEIECTAVTSELNPRVVPSVGGVDGV